MPCSKPDFTYSYLRGSSSGIFWGAVWRNDTADFANVTFIFSTDDRILPIIESYILNREQKIHPNRMDFLCFNKQAEGKTIEYFCVL